MELSEIGKKENFVKARTSNLYKLEDGNILKLFKNPRSVSEIARFKYFLNYANDSFVFPFEFIYDSEKFYGYITRFALGKTLEEVFPKSNLIDMSKNSFKLEKNIDFISTGGIILYDFHSENLLYNGNDYSAIDHDENGIGKDIESIKEQNRHRYRILMGNLFLNNLEGINNRHLKLIKDRIREYKYLQIEPSEMILKVKEDVDKYFKEEISSLEDITNIIKR